MESVLEGTEAEYHNKGLLYNHTGHQSKANLAFSSRTGWRDRMAPMRSYSSLLACLAAEYGDGQLGY